MRWTELDVMWWAVSRLTRGGFRRTRGRAKRRIGRPRHETPGKPDVGRRSRQGLPAPALSETGTTLAGAREQDGSAARSRRGELPGLRPVDRPEGADHRRRFRDGPRRG